MNPEIRILLVDDDKDYLDSMGFFLKSRGYDVETSVTAESAFSYIQKSPVDIVFLDYNMPGMDGMKLLEEVRKIDKNLPVVFVTGFVGDLEVNQAMKLGVAGIFPKTDPFLKLQSLIEVVLRTHKRLKS